MQDKLLPTKLVLASNSIKGIYKWPLNFIEGSNSEGYPTTIMTSSWYQFPPPGLTEGVKDIMELFVNWYNSRPETIDHFLNTEIEKMWLHTWDKEVALKHLSEKLDEYQFRTK